MTKLKELFLNSELRAGGFYELAIQVCQSDNNMPIKDYTSYIWSLDYVEGPFDENFNLITADIENIQHRGLITLGDYKIPFMTYNIREDEPVETGFNWFDICFYTSAIEHIFGEEYQTWSESPKVPIELTLFLENSIIELYKLFPFKLALKDFEISGQYYFKDLKTVLEVPFSPLFIIGGINLEKILESNRAFVTTVEKIEKEKYA